MRDHELRSVLNDELHGRPGLPVVAPARITHLAFTLSEGDPDPLEHVRLLCDALGVKPPPPGAPHHAFDIAGGQFKYERHGEFYRISVVAEGGPEKSEALVILPVGWVDGLPGSRLVGIHTRVMTKEEPGPDVAELIRMFGHEDLAGSRVSSGQATVWTDFRIGEDGYTRMLVKDHGLSPLRLGRVIRRIHEIETYRMMALLALPLARKVTGDLGAIDRALSKVTADMLSARESHEDAELLTSLSRIARDVEEISSRTSYRFSAARAYAALVDKRIAELGEERVMSFQRIGVFLDRRFSPAMATCQAVSERIKSLAERSERASNLLRTRVDIALEAQNQQVLQSMEKRGHQQLRLQQTVEGLSVVAISYYLIGILSKLIEGFGSYAHVETKLISIVIIPVVMFLVWYGVRRLRKHILSSERD
ncbi:MAG: DUF3422 domain-containing protein [Aestuariivirga sp.]|uniref:DUF3422 family protein n=1 Tax=Aestuariivirga sp. TaxID=2650926 RepID=UPI0025BE42CA|nr:DUF3422 domain-containing protein [Aestuariivirga sp.]MCA3559529.1 DUF3422 domain-containing protein [Aestuariivirga sp.]